MAQSMVNIRMDDELKSSFNSICDELGMSMSTAFIIFAKKTVREKRIPFEVSCDPFYDEKNMTALLSSIAQMKEGKTVSKTIEELEKHFDE